MQRAELKLSDIADCLRQDWINLAVQLGLTDQDVLDVQKVSIMSVFRRVENADLHILLPSC